MSRHVIDSSREEARELVDFLHNQSAFFRKHGGATLKHEADSLGNAAALLDSYQAGITLATPHAVTQASVIQWVSVSEALPADEEDVLIAIQRRLGGVEVTTGFIDRDAWHDQSPFPVGLNLCTGDFDGSKVTHWATLPEGPKPLATVADCAEELAA
jgi:hypothetical protein